MIPVQRMMLPQSNWKKLVSYIKLAGEDGSVSPFGDDLKFMQDLGVFSGCNIGELSEAGKNFFKSVFIRCDGLEKSILYKLLLQFPPVLAIIQNLWGVKAIKIDQVLAVLKTTGYWFYDGNKPLIHFLDLLNYAGVIKYNKKLRQIELLVSPDTPSVPSNIFIAPSRPYSNILWIRRIISECEGFVYWFDKHFQKEGLEWLWATADANKIKEIKILSLDMGEVNLGKSARDDYGRFKREMANKGIIVSWATIDSKLVRDTHDRWLMGGNKYLRNIPNVNAINSGQKSEMNFSDNYEEVLQSFNDYWKGATEIVV